jgi:hypothetical protein
VSLSRDAVGGRLADRGTRFGSSSPRDLLWLRRMNHVREAQRLTQSEAAAARPSEDKNPHRIANPHSARRRCRTTPFREAALPTF